MSDPVVFMIEEGEFGLAVVDTAAVGYLDAWQAPGGKTVDMVTLADYDAAAAGWTCQMTSGALTPTPNTTTSDIPATFCKPAKSIPTPGETTFTLDLTFLQDPNVSTGLNAFLYAHDTEEAYAYFGMSDGDPPHMIGRVRLSAGLIGGDARTTLVATIALPLTRRPDIEFGDATTSVIVVGSAGTGALAANVETAPAATATRANSRRRRRRVTVAQLRRAFDDLANVPESAIVDAAKLVEQAAKQTGRPITIRGRRYPLYAVTKYERANARAECRRRSYGTPTGFWVWQTTGTRGGYPIPKRRRAEPRYLYGAGWSHPVRGPVTRQRGIAGRGAWRRVRAVAERDVPKIFVAAVHDAVKGFG